MILDPFGKIAEELRKLRLWELTSAGGDLEKFATCGHFAIDINFIIHVPPPTKESKNMTFVIWEHAGSGNITFHGEKSPPKMAKIDENFGNIYQSPPGGKG